ncbi:hypothetical protein ACJ77P_12940 [Syntrophus buswellii]|uniref:hypothetical protein n=1 Tax=Syntrophus buswellii TaxID=43774 RepID=UPI0038D3A268
MSENESFAFDPLDAKNHYESLHKFSDTRAKEMNQMFLPFIDITDRYGLLISRLTIILGNAKPKDTQDIVLRDLMADVFDCLYESRDLIMGAKINVAFPVVRRAYESITLLNLCAINKSFANKWHSGKEIKNAEVRKELDKHPLGESKEDMKKLYNFYCLGSHPNRELIPRRFLGEGNQFVLGAIGKPNLWLACDLCIKILEMWFWLTAMVSVIYHDMLSKVDIGYNDAYSQTSNDAKEISKWLVLNFNNVLKEEQEYWINNPVKD